MITDQHARRVFVLEIAGLPTRYTSHDVDPSSANMSAVVVDGINYTNQRSIVDVGSFSGSIDPSGGIASYGAVTISLASDRTRGGESDPAVIFGRCGARAEAPFKAQIIEDLDYDSDSGTLDIDTEPSALSFPAVMHIGAETLKVTGYTSITGGARLTHTARAVGGSQRQSHRIADFGSFVPEVTSAITTFRGRRASLWVAQQYPDGSLSDFVELVNGFLDSSPIVEEGGVVSLSLLPISALIDTELSDRGRISTKLVQDFHYFDGSRASWFDWGVGLDNDSVYYIDKYLIDEVAGTYQFTPYQPDFLQMFSSSLPDGYDENYATPHPRYAYLEAPGVKVYLIPGGYDTDKSEGLSQSGTEAGADFFRVRTNPKIENKAVKLGTSEVKPWPDVLRAELSSDANFDLTPIGNERAAWAHLSISRGNSVHVRATRPPGVTRPYIVLSNASLKRLVVDGKAYEPKRWVGDGFGNGIVPYEPFGNVERIAYPLDLRQEGSQRAASEGIKLKLSVPDNDDNTTASYPLRDIARAWYQRRELTILVEGSIGLPTIATDVSYDLQVKFTDRDLGEERYQWIKATHESVASYDGVNIGYLIHLDRRQDWSQITSFGDWSDTERVEIFGGARFSRERPGSILLKLLQSGGGFGKNGPYDVYSLGLAIPSSDIDEASFLAYDGTSPFIFSGSISGEGVNLRDVVQDLLKLMGCALIMSRSSTGASLLTLQPIGAEVSADVKATIGEGDWLADAPPTWSIYEDIVTQVGVSYNWLIEEQKFTSQLTFNNQEAINRYGGERSKIDLDLYALTGQDIGSAVGDITGAFLPVMARLWRLLSNPIRSWRGSIGTGQSMLLDVGSYVSVSSPLLKGYGDEWGVSGEVGMVRSIRQDLMREGAEIELISFGILSVRWNASATVSSVVDSTSVLISANDFTDATTSYDADFFAVGDVVDYLPEGNEDNAITGLVIQAVSETAITFTTAHGITTAGGTLEPATYNSASAHHKADAYLASNASPPLLGSSTEAQEYS
jgi:hypothetical protein